MIALVASTLLPALFIGSGLFAAAVLGLTWRRYAGAYRRLEAQLALCDTVCEVSVRVTRHQVRQAASPVRPARRGAQPARRGVMSPVLSPALSVAA